MRALARAAQHWTQHYVGLSADDLTGSQRPSACFELVRHVYRGERRIFLPAHSAGSGWRLIPPHEAQAFDLVVFEHGGVAGHVGVLIAPWTMLHLPEASPGKAPMSSIIERFDNGSFLPRLAGIYRREEVDTPPPVLTCPPEGSVGLLGRPFINPETGKAINVPAGQSLAELVAHLYPATSEEQRARMRVTVGRHDMPLERWHEFPAECWANVTPHAGMTVAVEPLPGAIPFGKVLGLLALTAALALGQFYLAPLLPAAFGTVFASAATATALTAVSLILQGLRGEQKEAQDKQRFAATGWQNRVAKLEEMPDPFGKTRAAPPYAALPYISLGTGVPLQSYNWPYVFDALTGNVDPGNGKIRFSATVVSGTTSVTMRVDDLDNSAISHAAKLLALAASLESFTVRVTKQGAPTQFFTGLITAFTDASGWTNIDVGSMEVHGTNPIFSDGDILRLAIFTTATGNDDIHLHGLFAEAIGEGTISGRRLDQTPIENYDSGGGNPVEVEEFLVGPGDPWPFTEYDHTVVPTDPATMGANFPNGAGETDWVERVVARDCTAIEVFIRFDAGLFNFEEDGEVKSISVFFQWQYAPLGTEDWVDLDWTEQEGQSRTPFFCARKWTVARGDYKIRHRKIDKDSDWSQDQGQDGYTWIALQGHRPEAPCAPRAPITFTAFRVRSTDQLQGTIGSYNRLFHRKAWVWDGFTWALALTKNPASAFRYKLQSGALAVPYADADILLEQLEDWSIYCDLNEFEYNSTGEEVNRTLFDALNECAAAGRARTRRFNREWGVAVDWPEDIHNNHGIKGHITTRNGWAISAGIERTPEADGFRVTFSDETSDYSTKTRMVPFPGVDEGEVTKPIEISLPYTDPVTIYREALRLYYLTFELRLTRWSATASWDHMTYGAGDRVLLDDGLLRTRVAALVFDVSGNIVTLDESVTMLAGHSYQITFRHLPAAVDETVDSPPAVTVTRTVQTVVGESATVVLTGSGIAPAADNLVIFSEVGAGGIEAIVEQIEAGEDLTAKLSLTAYTPDLDELIADLDVPDWDGRVGAVP